MSTTRISRATRGASSPVRRETDLTAPAAAQRSDYSKILGERLRALAARLRARPGDPDVYKALNDVLAEARSNRFAIVEGEALTAAAHALAAARPHGPPSAAGTRLVRRVDPSSGRSAYSLALDAELRGAIRAFRANPTAQRRALLNKWLHEARSNPHAVVGMDLLKQAQAALARSPRNAESRRPVEQWVDFTSIPGATGGNYLGLETRTPAGDVTRLQVRLRARMQLSPEGQWRVVQMQAVGPQVTRNGRVISERFKVYDLGTIDPDRARARALQMLRHGGITTLNESQRQMLNQKLPLPPVIGQGEHRWTAPNLRYGSSPGQPNRMLGPAASPHTVERSGFNAAWHTTRTDPRPGSSALFVPNLVWEAGAKLVSGKKPSPFVFTVQPLLGFFPTSGGFPGFREQTRNAALVRFTRHPAGFYPGDVAGARWQAEFQRRPDTTPAFLESSLGYWKHLGTSNWWQCFGNIPNLFMPWRSSAHCRAIKHREEHRVGVYEQREVFRGADGKGFVVAQSLLSPYTWGQVQLKGGVANAGGKPAAFVTAPLQGELGFIVSSTTNPHMPNPRSAEPTDWQIVNGSVRPRTADSDTQFQQIARRFGLTLKAESVLPDTDRSAGIYLLVPANGPRTADSIARKLEEIGTTLPEFKELAFIDAQRLVELNPALRSGARPGTWINTGVRVGVGGPGLFVPEGE